MNERTRALLFGGEIPHDLFAEDKTILVYDVEKNATTGEEVQFPMPYNTASDNGPWQVTAEERVLRFLVQKFLEEDYVVRIPEYRGERFSLLVEKGGRRLLLVLALSSEAESKVLLASTLCRSYTVVILRDTEEKEPTGALSLSIDRALDSFNFQTL